jgi:hypothetical protein
VDPIAVSNGGADLEDDSGPAPELRPVGNVVGFSVN